MWQLADINTDAVGAEEYAGWIKRTIGMITKFDESTGLCTWVPDSEMLETLRGETRAPLKAFAKDATQWSSFFSGETRRQGSRARKRKPPAPAPPLSVPASAEVLAPSTSPEVLVSTELISAQPVVAITITQMEAPAPALEDGFFSPGGTWHPSKAPVLAPSPAPAPVSVEASDDFLLPADDFLMPVHPMALASPAPAEEEPPWAEDEGEEEFEMDAASSSSEPEGDEESEEESPSDELFGKGHRAGALLCAASSSYSRTLLRSASRMRAQTPPGHLMRAAGLTTAQTHPNYVPPNDPTMGLPLPRSTTAGSRRDFGHAASLELQPLSAPEQAAAAAAAAGAVAPWNDLFPASPSSLPRPSTSPAALTAAHSLRSGHSMSCSSASESQRFTPSTLPMAVAMRLASNAKPKAEGLSPPARHLQRSSPRPRPPARARSSQGRAHLGPSPTASPFSSTINSRGAGGEGGSRQLSSRDRLAWPTRMCQQAPSHRSGAHELQRASSASAIAPKLLDFSLGLPRPLSGARGKTHRQSSFGGSAFAPAGKSSCSPSLLPLHRQRAMHQLPPRPSTSHGAISRSHSQLVLLNSHSKLAATTSTPALTQQRRPQTSSGRDMLTRWALRYVPAELFQPLDVTTHEL